jgi:hypothetical protein
VHRDVLADFKVVSCFAIFVSGGLDAPGSPSTVPHPRFRLALGGPAPVGRAVRGCGDVVRAGWIAWQALVLVGMRSVRAEITGSREGAKPRSSDE